MLCFLGGPNCLQKQLPWSKGYAINLPDRILLCKHALWSYTYCRKKFVLVEALPTTLVWVPCPSKTQTVLDFSSSRDSILRHGRNATVFSNPVNCSTMVPWVRQRHMGSWTWLATRSAVGLRNLANITLLLYLLLITWGLFISLLRVKEREQGACTCMGDVSWNSGISFHKLFTDGLKQ